MTGEAEEVPPPGVGLTTVTFAVPATATSLAGMTAVSRVVLTNVVVRLLPFHCTTEVETKFEPFTVKEKDCPPASTAEGDKELILGTGLLIGGLWLWPALHPISRSPRSRLTGRIVSALAFIVHLPNKEHFRSSPQGDRVLVRTVARLPMRRNTGKVNSR